MKSDRPGPSSGPESDQSRDCIGKEQNDALRSGIKTTVDCIPCFVRQALDSVRLSIPDHALREQVMQAALLAMAHMDMSASPPVTAQKIHRRLREITGVADPYREAKDRFNLMALNMMPELAAKVANAPDPLGLAARLAIAGNVIDLGAKADLDADEARTEVAGYMEQSFHGDLEAFRRAVESAERILYLTDNAGEIVFDRLLIEQLRPGRVTVAVRGSAIINDATLLDARKAGIMDIAEVIDNGSDVPGTALSECGDDFRRRFREADVIIAKGQGNFETLAGEAAPVYFLFKVKCRIIASHTGLPVGTHVLKTP